MSPHLFAGALPGVMLTASLLTALLWPREIVPVDLRFATGVVRLLQKEHVPVRQVARWDHSPFDVGTRAATIRTDMGWVGVVTFDDADDLSRLRVIEASTVVGRERRYIYTVNGWPNATEPLTWEAGAREFLTIHGNWLLVTSQPAVDGVLKRSASRFGQRF